MLRALARRDPWDRCKRPLLFAAALQKFASGRGEVARRYLGYLRGKSYRELELSSYDLDLVGMRPTPAMTYGLLSPQTVRAKLEEMGLPTDDARIREVYDAMKERLDALGNKFPVMLNEEEIEDICRRAQRR